MSQSPGAVNGQLHGDRGPALEAVQIVMIVLAVASVAFRFLARRVGGSALLWDDWAIVLAAVFSVAVNVTILMGVSFGLGKHLLAVPDYGHKYLKTLFIMETLHTTALAILKISVLLFYHRLFGIDRKFTICLKLVAGLVIAWWLAIELTTILQCQPVARFWNYRLEGVCIDLIAFTEGAAIPNVVTDVLILLLPQPIIWKLHLSWSTRLCLCGVFLIGAFTACTSIGRLVAIYLFKDKADFTWSMYAVIIWFSVEPAIGIFSACLPCMGPLLRKLPGSPFMTSMNNSYTGRSGPMKSAESKGTGLRVSTFGARSERRPSDFETDSTLNLRPDSHAGGSGAGGSTKGGVFVVSQAATPRESVDHTSTFEESGHELEVIHTRRGDSNV